MELLRGFHLWLNGMAANTMRCWSNVSVSDVGPGWWYWEAVYYNFQKGPSCLSSASLSAKLAVLQLFVDTHRLFLPTDFSQTAWNEILCRVEILGSVWRTITSSHCRGRDFLMVTKNCTGAVGTHREATLIPSAEKCLHHVTVTVHCVAFFSFNPTLWEKNNRKYFFQVLGCYVSLSLALMTQVCVCVDILFGTNHPL